MAMGDKVEIIKGKRPEDYHCLCKYCKVRLGELRPKDGSYYSRLERRQYYEKSIESGNDGHVAKTPLHVARWAIQSFTKPEDWVLDPTIGAGTTAVEALTQNRNVAGMELQFAKAIEANVKKNLNGHEAWIRVGDARNIGDFLKELDIKFQLVVNNPPYSGDEHLSTMKSAIRKNPNAQSGAFRYQSDLPNLAFLKEGQEYWDTMKIIYGTCIEHLLPGGYFVTGIKDMMRNKVPFTLHTNFCDLLTELGMQFVGTAFLRHHPPTQFMSTYSRMPHTLGIQPPKYQTINVFRKPL